MGRKIQRGVRGWCLEALSEDLQQSLRGVHIRRMNGLRNNDGLFDGHSGQKWTVVDLQINFFFRERGAPLLPLHGKEIVNMSIHAFIVPKTIFAHSAEISGSKAFTSRRVSRAIKAGTTGTVPLVPRLYSVEVSDCA